MKTPAPPAFAAITKRGAAMAARAAREYPGATLYVRAPWDEGLESLDADLVRVEGPLREAVPGLMANHDPIVFFAALGAVVRLIAPHLKNKREDPAVLALDEGGRFVIPVVSGHLGGANDHARKLAAILGATPVITTASDAVGTLPVDILGRTQGWEVHAEPEVLTRVAAAIVNRQPVALLQEHGGGHWRRAFDPFPANVAMVESAAEADPETHEALLLISRNDPPVDIQATWAGRLVHYRPPRGQGEALSVGLGCDRGTPLKTVEEALDDALAATFLDGDDIRVLATIDKKRDEAAFLELAEKRNLPLTFYSAEELARVPVPHPSETVMKYVGTPSVSEAAALLAGQTEAEDLLVEKHRHKGADGKNATVSISLFRSDSD